MASIAKKTLLEVVGLSANTNSDSQSMPGDTTGHIAYLKCANVVGGGTIAGTITHSADKTNWVTLATFTGLSAAGVELQAITASILPNIRAEITITAGTADVEASLWYDPRTR